VVLHLMSVCNEYAVLERITWYVQYRYFLCSVNVCAHICLAMIAGFVLSYASSASACVGMSCRASAWPGLSLSASRQRKYPRVLRYPRMSGHCWRLRRTLSGAMRWGHELHVARVGYLHLCNCGRRRRCKPRVKVTWNLICYKKKD